MSSARRAIFVFCALQAAASAEDLATKAHEIFAANCFGCHSAKVASGNLKLDTRDSVLRVVTPGDPDSSLLIQAVRRTHAKIKMPPGGALPQPAVETLAEWVRKGAAFPEANAAKTSAPAADYWAFRPLPSPKGTIDEHWRAGLAASHAQPAPPASKQTILRRVTLDLTGLPPTPAELDAFLADDSPKALEKVVDRLLASPQYGVRYARLWLDLARYSDGALAAGTDTPFPNAWRYRDWVVEAMNRDLPYSTFVKAQVAADLLPDAKEKNLLAGLGFQALSAGVNDQVDTTTKVFLGLTVGCAQCHDHKYDPIPTRDYYSLFGIFKSSKTEEYPLVGSDQVKQYKDQKAKVDAQKELIDEYLVTQQKLVTDILVRHTARYLMAVWKGVHDDPTLDKETLERWHKYLADPNKEHPYAKPWFDAVQAKDATEESVRKAAEAYQKFLLQLIDDQKEVEDKNYVAFGGKKGQKDERTRQYTNIVSLPVLKYYQWREIAAAPYRTDGHSTPAGVLYYSPKEVERFLTGFHKAHLDQLRAEMDALKKDLPPIYPFLHSMREGDKFEDAKIQIRGDAKNLGEIAPRRFLSCLSPADAKPVANGSGRLQLAESIASHPLTYRVIANRLWQWHFGQALVRTPSNFGRNGDPPVDPALLDQLAARLYAKGGSLKSLHREIVLSEAYSRSSLSISESASADPENRRFWRFPAGSRLDFETLRDAILAVSGELEEAKLGGEAKPLKDDERRRSLYLQVSRTRLDPTMALFDFPDPNLTAEARTVTTGPLQGLYFLNSPFVTKHSERLAQQIVKDAPSDPVTEAYRRVLGRQPTEKEHALGAEVTQNADAWPRYVQVLLSTAEFLTRP